jgi:hypothetical protein
VQSFLAFQALETPENHFFGGKVIKTIYLKLCGKNTEEKALFAMTKRERTPIPWHCGDFGQTKFHLSFSTKPAQTLLLPNLHSPPHKSA